MRISPSYYGYTGGTLAPTVPSIPSDPEWMPPVVPDQPGEQGEDFLVAVGGFPTGAAPKVMWEATVEGLTIRDTRIGPNTVNVSFPTTPTSMRIFGSAITDEQTEHGTQLYDVKQAISREVRIGSTVDGLDRWRFAIRDQVKVADGRVSVSGVGFTGGVTGDVIIGAPEPRNLLDPGASFEGGSLAGWTLHGSGSDAGVVAAGPDGSFCAWVTGTPDSKHYLERRVRYSQPERPWGRQRVAGLSLVKLPGYGLEIESYGLVTVAVLDTSGNEVWPNGAVDREAGIVTTDMKRGEWDPDYVVGIGYLPVPPFTCDICIRLHPVDETERVYYDDPAIVRRENTSTVVPADTTLHVKKLLDHAQDGRDKSPKGLQFVQGTPTGNVEIGTWWHEDAQPLNDAFAALADVEIYDSPGPGRRITATKRRGVKRSNMVIQPWHCLGTVDWEVDPGGQRTAVRAVSSAGSLWGGANAGAIDTSQANGQVIDLTLSAPVGMTPKRLRRWLMDQLATYKLLQANTTLLLAWRVGMRLKVGDSLRVAMQDGSAGHKDWFRVTQWAPDLAGQRFVAVDLGTDPDDGGR